MNRRKFARIVEVTLPSAPARVVRSCLVKIVTLPERLCMLLALAMLAALFLLLAADAGAGPPPLLRLTSEGPDFWFGGSIASPGDVNGDGYDDFIVAAQTPTGARLAAIGGAYVYFGGPVLGSQASVRLTSEALSFVGGYAPRVAAAGDVNGDGFADIITTSPIGGRGGGRIFLYYGASVLSTQPGLVVSSYPQQPGEGFGAGAAGIGDLNGDGHADFLVGAPHWIDFVYEPEHQASGKIGHVLAYFGSAAPDTVPDLVIDTPSPKFTGIDYRFGYTIAPAGDFNGDGHPDFVVAQERAGSAPYYGRAFVYFGGPALDQVADRTLKMAPYGAFTTGLTVSSAGDYNADGFDDLLVRAAVVRPDGSGWSSNPGRAYVYFGGANTAENQEPALTLQGDPSDGDFGLCVSGGKDVNGDGLADIVVGAPMAAPEGPRRGRVYVFYGGPDADASPDAILDGEIDGGGFGMSLTGADITGDGVADLIVGAPGWPTPPATAPGHVYVYDLASPLPARAFLRDDQRTIPLASAQPVICAQFEPVAGTYANEEVDLSTLRLVSHATGTVAEIRPVSSKTAIEGDTDRNGVSELSVCFAHADFQQLFSGVRGRRTVEAALEGRLTTGRKISAPIVLTLLGIPAVGPKAASVSPNPLNPQGVLEFSTVTAGPTTVRLYDIRGRLIRTFLQGRYLNAGTHAVVIDGHDEHGASLPSGIFFYQIDTHDGPTRGRLVIAK